VTLAADVTVRFALPGGSAFAIESDNRDSDQRLPFVHHPAAEITAAQLAQPIGRYQQPVTPARYGRHVLRVYHDAALPVQLQTLDPTSGWTEDTRLGVNGYTIVTVPGSGRSGSDAINRGRRTQTVRETLRFDGQSEATVRYPYDSPAVTVLATSLFLDADGNAAAQPQPRTYGRFISDRPVYGALAVEYAPSYTEWWIFYEGPTGVPYEIIERADAAGVVTGHDVRWPWADTTNRILPELTVVATWENQLQAIALEREILDYSLTLSTGKRKQEDDGSRRYQETSRGTVTSRVENPTDPGQYVDVAEAREVRFQNANGEILTLTLNPVQ